MQVRASATIALLAALLFVTAAAVHAYSTFGGKWASFPVVVYLNPANQDVTTSAAIAAIQSALNVWNTQSGTSFRYQYGGTVSDTATAHDNRNVVFFRNVSNGGVIATTYSWWSGSQMLDSDVIFWDGGFKFYTGTTGCTTTSSSAYIEDVATHELGHALGLGHSSVSDATMYSTYMMCTQTKRTLASDDIAGARALYPATTVVANTAPTVVITSPANGATFVQGSTISLAATATDTQDGNISSRVQWTDNGAAVGSGSLLSSIISVVGTHTFVAKVTDNNGAQASSQVSVTITQLQQANTAPTVVITSPANGATFVQGSTISLAATASDTQDGNISSRVQWTDNGVAVGSGSLLSSIISVVGTHTIVAKVTDNNGAQASRQVSITITALLQQPSGGTTGTLTTKQAVNADGLQKTYLYWTGLAGTYVDVYRNNAKINTTLNDGYWGDDNLPTKAPGTYYYFICPSGTTNWSSCTNTVKVVF